MTTLTQTVASLNDALVPSLSFQLPKASSYVSARQSQQIFPIGAGEYKPMGGTNLIRINLATNGWWDPLTMRLRFKVTNNCNWSQQAGQPGDTTLSRLSLLGPPGILFQRIRVLCNGVVLQDSGIYNAREYYMFYNLLRDPMRVVQDQLEAPWSSINAGGVAAHDWSIYGMPNLGANFRYYNIPLPSGIFNQPLFWHGTSAPITLELQLQTDSSAPFMPQINNAGQDVGGYKDWTISEVSVVGDVITLSSDFQKNFDHLLLSGSTIPIPYKGMYTQYQVIVPNTSSIQIIAQRAFSRVSCVFVHFTGMPLANSRPQPKLRPYGNGANATGSFIPITLKECNYFASPVGNEPSLQGDLLEAQLHIGGLVIPSLPQRGLSTMFMYLRQCVHQEYAGATNITTLDEYGTSSFILGFNLKRQGVIVPSRASA